jgi:putative SOS response-associated peptidase YedK
MRREIGGMCGRYAAFRSLAEIQRLFGTVNALPNLPPSWNVAPTHDAAVVRRHPESGQRHLDLLHWGLVPHWARDPKSVRQPINARSETAAAAPMFSDALRRRRCIVPIDAFYEWQATPSGKVPHAVARADGAVMALAGLWEGWRGSDGTVLRSFTVLTTSACEALAHLHDRMPVVLEPPDWALWLGEEEGDHAALLRPSSAELRIWPVSAAIGSVRNNGPELLAVRS